MIFFLVLDEGMRLGRVAAEAAAGQLWQGVAVAAGLALCLRFAPRMRASFRYALWLAAFVLLAALPLVPWIASWLSAVFAGAPQAVAGAQAASAAPVAWLRLDERWSLAIVALWALMALVRFGMLARGAVRARSLWMAAQPLEGSRGRAFPLTSTKNMEVNEAQSVSALAGERLVGRGPVEICSSSHVDRPCVIGFFRPRILIPAWLVGKLSPGELRQIVLHELEHLRRCDDWTNLGLQFALVLLPLNPALLWMERRLEREREMACDEAVVRRTHAPRAYAACLASVAERRMERKLSAQAAFELAAWRRRPELAERVMSLLRAKETLSPAGRAAFAGVFGCALLAATVGLARCPQLVAFAPAPQPVVQANAAPLQAGAEKVAARKQQARPTVASLEKSTHSEPRAPSAETEEFVAQASTEPGLVRVVAPMGRHASADRKQAQSQQPSGWIILTVFEQRTVVGPQGTAVADYEIEEERSSTVLNSEKKTPVQKIEVIPLARIGEGWVVWEL